MRFFFKTKKFLQSRLVDRDKMSSILSYFQKTKKQEEKTTNIVVSACAVPGVSTEELNNIKDQLQVTGTKRKRATFSEEDKNKIAQYANTCGVTSAVRVYGTRISES